MRAVRALFGGVAQTKQTQADPCRGCRWRRAGEQCVLPSCFRQKEEGEWKKRNAR